MNLTQQQAIDDLFSAVRTAELPLQSVADEGRDGDGQFKKTAARLNISRQNVKAVFGGGS